MDINLQKIKELMKNSKNLALKKVLPFVMATGFMVGGTVKAEAANIEFPDITISYSGNDEYVNEKDYTSSYLTDYQAKELREIIEDIDSDFQEVYTILANGGMNSTKNNNMARMLASIDEIERNYEEIMDGLNNKEKQIIQKYLKSKINESKLVFSSVTNIPVRDLDSYADNYTCTFVKKNNNFVNVGIYKIKNNEIIDSKIISFNDTNLSKQKTLVVIPNLVTIYSNSKKPTFKTEYNAVIIPKNDEKMCRQAMSDTDIFYDKIEAAINDGNYTIKNGISDYDIFLAIYGDTNLVKQTINDKYAYYTNLSKAINQYLDYKQSLMVSKVYTKNYNQIDNYNSYTSYGKNNHPIRISEDGEYTYYKDNNDILVIIDRGYLDTSDLQSSVTNKPSISNQIDIYTGVNFYVDGELFIPRDVDGKKTLAFIYNNTAYLPVDAAQTLYDADITWENKVIYINSNDIYSDEYYYDDYGNKIYLKDYPQVPTTNERPNRKLSKKEVSATTNNKVYFDGKLVNNYKILNINGVTYLPITFFANKFDTQIEQTTNDVILNRNGYIIDNGDHDYDNFDGAYYYDDNGDRVYINEDEYKHFR